MTRDWHMPPSIAAVTEALFRGGRDGLATLLRLKDSSDAIERLLSPLADSLDDHLPLLDMLEAWMGFARGWHLSEECCLEWGWSSEGQW